MNKKNPTSSNKRFGALALAATVLAGVVGYETVEFQNRKLPARSPLAAFVVPSLEEQSEKLLLELNEAKQEVNSLKRLLFQQNFAKENAKISELQTLLKSKEEQLDKLQDETIQQKTRLTTLESALGAVKDLVVVQTNLKEQFKRNLTDQVAKTRLETIDEAKVIIDILESQLSYNSDRVNFLLGELLYEQQLSFITQEIQEREIRNLDDYIKKLGEDRALINDELMIAKMLNVLSNKNLLKDLTYLNLMNESLMSEVEIAIAHREQAQQTKFSLTTDLSDSIESRVTAENLLYKTQADLDAREDQVKHLAKKTAEMQDEMQLLELLYSYGSSKSSEKQVEIDQLQQELLKLVDTIQQTDTERTALNDSLNDLLTELAYQIDTHHSIIGSLSDDLTTIQNEKISLEEEIAHLKEVQIQKEQMREDLEKELSLSFDNQEKLKLQILDLEIALDDKSRSLQSTIDSYLKEKDDLELSFQKLKMDLYAQEVVNTYIAPLEHELLEKEAIYKKNVQEKEIALADAEEQVRTLQQRLLLEQHTSIQLQKELNEASSTPAYDSVEVARLYDELEKSRLLIGEYQNKLESKETDWVTQLVSFEKAQDLLSNEIESLKRDLVIAEDKHQQTLQESDKLTLDLKQSLETLKQLEKKIQAREDAYEKTIDELEELNQNLLVELEHSRQNRFSEEEKAAHLNDSLLEANDALEKTQKLLESLEEKLKVIDDTLQQSSIEHQSSLNEIDRLQELLSSRVEEVIILENQLSEVNERYYHSINELDALSELLKVHEDTIEIGDLP